MNLIRWLCVLSLLFLTNMAREYHRSTDGAIYVAAVMIILALPKEPKDKS